MEAAILITQNFIKPTTDNLKPLAHPSFDALHKTQRKVFAIFTFPVEHPIN